jgi:hypothetical protein
MYEKVKELIEQYEAAKKQAEELKAKLEAMFHMKPKATRARRKKHYKWGWYARKKLSAAMTKRWSSLTPEKRAEWVAKIRGAKQK